MEPMDLSVPRCTQKPEKPPEEHPKLSVPFDLHSLEKFVKPSKEYPEIPLPLTYNLEALEKLPNCYPQIPPPFKKAEQPPKGHPEICNFEKADSTKYSPPRSPMKDTPAVFPRYQLLSGVVTPPAQSPDAMVPTFDHVSSTDQPFPALSPNSLILDDLDERLLTDDELQRQAEEILRLRTPNSRLSNSNMRRGPYPTSNADPEYLEKRRKNNEAAKRSRDNRRQREELLAVKYTIVQNRCRRQHGIIKILWYEYHRLRKEVEALKR